MSALTPSQTVGPYFRIGLEWPAAWRLGEACDLTLRGRVLDGDGVPVTDALLEIWQADADGNYFTNGAHGAHGFRGFGRCAVDAAGAYRFQTIKPGAVAAPDGGRQAPHINLLVMARGLLQHLYTRVYFPDDAALHEADSVLGCVPAARRHTLIARPAAQEFTFDIHLQGEHETVFFAL
ncbi:MAG: protocatechuate 3,4-dioxygenase subunit alpha [Gammaproteobacteria bacterium]|jgi:protocatechuate 3,4-dioxygenase alpha subunit|nr:protocatechuate 3,4-dioxygenase subunit alpha [Gammaproteobacteria bacterium]